MSKKIYFYKGSENILEKEGDDKKKNTIETIKESFAKVLDGKNLSFLLGSGCSSYRVDGEEVGIPTMKPLAAKFYKKSQVLFGKSSQYGILL
jgi:hypothetical protein